MNDYQLPSSVATFVKVAQVEHQLFEDYVEKTAVAPLHRMAEVGKDALSGIGGLGRKGHEWWLGHQTRVGADSAFNAAERAIKKSKSQARIADLQKELGEIDQLKQEIRNPNLMNSMNSGDLSPSKGVGGRGMIPKDIEFGPGGGPNSFAPLPNTNWGNFAMDPTGMTGAAAKTTGDAAKATGEVGEATVGKGLMNFASKHPALTGVGAGVGAGGLGALLLSRRRGEQPPVQPSGGGGGMFFR